MNRKSVIIRPIEDSEISTCFSMMKELAILEKEEDKIVITEDDFRDQLTSNPRILNIMGAFVDGEILGMAIYYYRYSTWVGKTIHLEDLFIKEESRGLGLGKKLLNTVMDIAKENNVKRVEWEAHRINEKALNFYRKYGADIADDWIICRMEL